MKLVAWQSREERCFDRSLDATRLGGPRASFRLASRTHQDWSRRELRKGCFKKSFRKRKLNEIKQLENERCRITYYIRKRLSLGSVGRNETGQRSSEKRKALGSAFAGQERAILRETLPGGQLWCAAIPCPLSSGCPDLGAKARTPSSALCPKEVG